MSRAFSSCWSLYRDEGISFQPLEAVRVPDPEVPSWSNARARIWSERSPLLGISIGHVGDVPCAIVEGEAVIGSEVETAMEVLGDIDNAHRGYLLRSRGKSTISAIAGADATSIKAEDDTEASFTFPQAHGNLGRPVPKTPPLLPALASLLTSESSSSRSCFPGHLHPFQVPEKARVILLLLLHRFETESREEVICSKPSIGKGEHIHLSLSPFSSSGSSRVAGLFPGPGPRVSRTSLLRGGYLLLGPFIIEERRRDPGSRELLEEVLVHAAGSRGPAATAGSGPP